MADTTGFTHITVSTDDDDVVIQAGIADAPAAPDAPVAPDAPPESDEGSPVVGGEPASAAVDGPAEADAPEMAAGDAPASAGGAPATPAAARPDDGYRETTLQDIEDAKMSSTQKVVIIAALLGIIAFVVWYVLAR